MAKDMNQNQPINQAVISNKCKAKIMEGLQPESSKVRSTGSRSAVLEEDPEAEGNGVQETGSQMETQLDGQISVERGDTAATPGEAGRKEEIVTIKVSHANLTEKLRPLGSKRVANRIRSWARMVNQKK